MDSYLNESWIQQWKRVLRFLERVDGAEAKEDQEGHTDDLLTFFMHCWHLKDWIKSDDNVSQSVRDSIRNDIDNSDNGKRKYPNLMICADVANRAKHLKFDLKHKPRVDAAITNQSVEIPLGTMSIDPQFGSSPQTGDSLDDAFAALEKLVDPLCAPKPTSQSCIYEYTISCGDGMKHDAKDVARNAVEEWKRFLKSNGLI